MKRKLIWLFFQLTPDQLKFLEIVGDSVESAIMNVYVVPRKSGIVEENVTDFCCENVQPITCRMLNPSMATQVQVFKPKINPIQVS
ncbi:unnamed protein product [Macrosiphum euphorbiae]|uniref:Uncharacterized protein n=1 Tax=Macrosiphum euphorbiae TaxID=13131 RepID=A0AAV0W150_9HEMI|nr:unnamed protein product [Macrosiphum euphorbiae]